MCMKSNRIDNMSLCKYKYKRPSKSLRMSFRNSRLLFLQKQ